MRPRGWAVLPVMALCAVATGCGGGRHGPVSIEVDAPVALADQAVHLVVAGLSGKELVTVEGQARDERNRVWTSKVEVRADAAGTVNLDRAVPVSGTYHGADGMGLLWSITPPDGDPDTQSYFPGDPTAAGTGYQVRIAVLEHGKQVASRALTRQWTAPGGTVRTLTMATDGVPGTMFLPPAPASPVRRPGVLIFGGSEGGNSGISMAALLSAHGYPALSIAYFHAPGLPAQLRDIPLEYFAKAARLLGATPGVDPAHVLVSGYSRGSEAALLTAQYFPDLVHGALLYAPSAAANAAFPDRSGSAWTRGGTGIPAGTLIPVDHVSGPVLAFAGDRDALWNSEASAKLIIDEIDVTRTAFTHQALVYPESGHGVGTYPYLPRAVRGDQPITGEPLDLGGTRAGDEAAREKGWQTVLTLLTGLDG